MSNNPDNRKLSSQFGDITGPSDSDLTNIEDGNDGGYYTQERIEDMRRGTAHLNANYSAVLGSRDRTRGTGATDFGISRAADKGSAAAAESEYLVGSAGTDGGKNTGGSSDFDAADTHGKYRGSGFSGMDVEAGPRASSFDRNPPRSKDESSARLQGMMFLKIAGPTCNHPTCQAYRAKGIELLGRGLGNDRPLVNDPGTARSSSSPIPSVRRDESLARMELRPESANVPEGQRKGSFKTGQPTDMGDFVQNQKNRIKTPIYEPQDEKNPRWTTLVNQWKSQGKGKGRGAGKQKGAAGSWDEDILTPETYLEHHHAPDEVNYKLPWEA